MDVCSDEEGSSANAGGAAPSLNPVPLHALDELQRSLSDAPHALLEIQPGSESVHVEAGVYGPASAAGAAAWKLRRGPALRSSYGLGYRGPIPYRGHIP